MYIIDIDNCYIGQIVTITGFVEQKRKMRTHLGMYIKDITGEIGVKVSKIEKSGELQWSSDKFHVGTRINITGEVQIGADGKRILDNVSNVEVLGRLNAKLGDLGSEMFEQASRMLMSRICRKAADYLASQKFTEFESRVISTQWVSDGLEPLLVNYPGFGSPAVLTASPATQVLDFLATTLSSRAFTVSTSFSTTFRFENGPADLRVIVAKAIDLDAKSHQYYLLDITKKSLQSLRDNENVKVAEYTGVWPDRIDKFTEGEKFSADINLVKYKSDFHVEGDSWDFVVDTIFHIYDKDGMMLAEGAREVVRSGIIISSIVLYPSQMLCALKKAPIRQLRDLGRFNVWDNSIHQ